MMARRSKWRVGGVAALVLSLLAGCAAPPVRELALRSEAPVGRSGATVANGEWPDAHWWRGYGDATLDALIVRAFESAPGIAAAEARLAAARQSVMAAGAAAGAQVQASADLSRQRLSDNGLISPEFLGFNWYNQADLGLDIRYSLDWWGRQKAAIEASVDEARAAEADKAAARLVLASAVAEAYFGWQADQQKLVLSRQRLAAFELLTKIMGRRVEAQLDNADTLRMANYGLAAAREQLSGVEGSARLRVIVLAALVGVPEDVLPRLEARPLPGVARQAALPANLSMDLLGRRPDVVASRWRVEAARQGVAEARAAYYPDISLRALAGLSSVELGSLLQAGSADPAVGLAVHLPLFDGGLRDARHGLRNARLDAAIAAYDDAVVGAVREVAAAVSTARTLAVQREQRGAQLDANHELLASAESRVKAGTSDIRPQLVAALQVNTTQESLVQTDLAALLADIGLRRALGGGYTATEKSP
ncbi:MAG: hypothetical protein RLZZ393_1353 [Pseudomonadota bacterium]|jgi:multidrug efflux system outer membrane protein